MLTRKRLLLNACIGLFLPQMMFTGCTLIGFAIGAISDGSHVPSGTIVSFNDVRKIEPGTQIRVTRVDSLVVEGEFVGTKEMNANQYILLYRQAVDQAGDSAHLPMPRENIKYALRMEPERLHESQFLGVDPGVLILSRAGLRVPVIDVLTLKGDRFGEVDMSALRSLVAERRLPYLTLGLLVKLSSDTAEVPYSSILHVAVTNKSHGALTGALVGLSADLLVLIIAANNEHESCAESSCSKPQSCNQPHSSSCNAK